ncbi:MAG: hypothetical protein HC894_02545 [Microcoleus sp. SM1_3_4]|nr:hypothetical protein [Microcoleus sp. SM1_3_4]
MRTSVRCLRTEVRTYEPLLFSIEIFDVRLDLTFPAQPESKRSQAFLWQFS